MSIGDAPTSFPWGKRPGAPVQEIVWNGTILSVDDEVMRKMAVSISKEVAAAVAASTSPVGLPRPFEPGLRGACSRIRLRRERV